MELHPHWWVASPVGGGGKRARAKLFGACATSITCATLPPRFTDNANNTASFNYIHDIGRGDLDDMGCVSQQRKRDLVPPSLILSLTPSSPYSLHFHHAKIYHLGYAPGTKIMNNVCHNITTFRYGLGPGRLNDAPFHACPVCPHAFYLAPTPFSLQRPLASTLTRPAALCIWRTTLFCTASARYAPVALGSCVFLRSNFLRSPSSSSCHALPRSLLSLRQGFHQHYGMDNTLVNNIFAYVDAELCDAAIRSSTHDNPGDEGDTSSFSFTRNIVYVDNGAMFFGTTNNRRVLPDLGHGALLFRPALYCSPPPALILVSFTRSFANETFANNVYFNRQGGAGNVLFPCAPQFPYQGQPWLPGGAYLTANDTLYSPGKTASARVSDDGNFCIFLGSTQLWCSNSGTGKHTGEYRAILQVGKKERGAKEGGSPSTFRKERKRFPQRGQ